MTDHNALEIAKKLLLDGASLEENQQQALDPSWRSEHADLCRRAAACIQELTRALETLPVEAAPPVWELTADEVLALSPGTTVRVIHSEKGSWEDTLTEILGFLDMYDVKLESGAFLPMEEYGKKWRLHHLAHTE